jgi:hypothetical protein
MPLFLGSWLASDGTLASRASPVCAQWLALWFLGRGRFFSGFLANTHPGICQSTNADVCDCFQRTVENERLLGMLAPCAFCIKVSRAGGVLDADDTH